MHPYPHITITPKICGNLKNGKKEGRKKNQMPEFKRLLERQKNSTADTLASSGAIDWEIRNYFFAHFNTKTNKSKLKEKKNEKF